MADEENPARLALSMSGIPFQDDRVPPSEWGSRKAQTPFGVNLMLRLPPDVHEALVEAAQHKGVSLNHEIATALRVHLDPQMVTWELQEIRSIIDEVVEQRLQEVSWKKSA